ncbi:MAG: hypothetical protein ACI9VN_003195, partial [Patescibacteria group bacterium]
ALTIGDETYTESGNYQQDLLTTFGCDSVVMIDLSVSSSVVTELAAVICEGEALTVGDETYTESGNYQQNLLTILGCDSIVTIDFLVNPNPVVSIGSNAVIITDSTLVLTLDGSQYESILWNDGSTSDVFVFDGATSGVGTFDVSVIVENEFNCFSTAILEITVEDNSGLFDIKEKAFSFTLSPNPVDETLTLLMKENMPLDYEIRLMNCLGEVVLQEEHSVGNISLDVSTLSSGLYFVLAKEAGASSFASRRVVVK